MHTHDQPIVEMLLQEMKKEIQLRFLSLFKDCMAMIRDVLI